MRSAPPSATASCRARDIAEGDVILGLASSGVHSNGYSLVRKVVEKSGLPWSAPAPFAPEQSLGEAILTPTRIYVKSCLAAIRATGAVKGLAHITGGGFPDNIPRVLPKGLGARIDLGAGAGEAGVQVARRRRRHRAGRNAAHLQLRHRHDRGRGARPTPRASRTRSPAPAKQVVELGDVIRADGEPRVVYRGALDLQM